MAALLYRDSFTAPLKKTYQRLISQLQSPSPVNRKLRAIADWNAYRDFRLRLQDIERGLKIPAAVCSLQVIGGKSYYVLENSPWRGYLTDLGQPPALTAVLFVDTTALPPSAIESKLRQIVQAAAGTP